VVRFAAALLFVALFCPCLWAQGRLEEVRAEVAKPAPAKNSGASSGSRSDADDGCELDGLGWLVWWPVLVPFAVPHFLLHDDFHKDSYFLPYPYAANEPGYLCREWSGALGDERTASGTSLSDLGARHWSGQLLLENGNDFNGLNRLNGSLVLDTSLRLGLRTNWHYFNETLDGGRHDDLLLGDTNLTFRFAQNECASLYAGLGFRALTGPGQPHWGWNFTYGADVYPIKPIVISATLDVGSLGSATVFHVRGTVGYIYERWEVFAGYDFLRIGTVNLQGPLVGVRLWF
jgi:hypothetical protein